MVTGQRLGPYEVLGKLGEGGMGEVYKAHDTRLDRTVAIKVLPDWRADDPDARERFEREARAISALDHPNICALYDVGRHESTPFLVMQYLEGETLAARLARAGRHESGAKRGATPLGTLSQALDVALQMLTALDAAHRCGITHRDLKPGNIMLTSTGVKLLDFGLAKRHAVGGPIGASPLTATVSLTTEGSIVGTLQYMAPEQLEGKPVDARADVFAFGAVLYEMLTGRAAFEGLSQPSLMAAILEREPPALSTLPLAETLAPPPVVRRLDRLIAACLEKDPDRRWCCAADLSREVRWIVEEYKRWEPGSEASAQPGRTDRTARIWRAAAAVMSGAAIALAIALVLPARSATPEVSTRFTIEPPQGRRFPAAPGILSVSPDGRQLVFLTSDPTTRIARNQMWVRRFDALDAQVFVDNANAPAPAWSPDSRSLAFVSDDELRRIDLAGGPPRTLARAGFGIPAWSRAGVILFNGTDGALWQVAAGGGPAARVTTIDRSRDETAHAWPTFLPDGRRYLYRIASRQVEHAGIFVGSLDDPSEKRRILDANSSVAYAPAPNGTGSGYLLYVRDHTLLAHAFDPDTLALHGEPLPVAHSIHYNSPGNGRAAFAVSDTGVLVYRTMTGEDGELAWLDRAGRQLDTIGGAEYVSPRLSPDGTRLLVSRNDALAGAPLPRGVEPSARWDLWGWDLARGVPARLSFDDERDETAAAWSPDGASIAFASIADGRTRVLQKPAGGAGAERLLFEYPRPLVTEAWTHDGSHLIVTARNAGGGNTGDDIARLPVPPAGAPAATEASLTPVVQTPFNEGHARVSADGRWLAYHSDESGALEVYVQPFPPTGDKWRISHAGGHSPEWRRDGRELFFLARDNQRVMAAEIASVKGQLVPATPRELLATRYRGISRSYGVRADGQRFLMPLAKDGAAPPITVVLNWTREIETGHTNGRRRE